ncbi:MAG: DNA polymerase IV [Deltaproteobacteria bacterium]|nr:DNA polymerase IV [Deltaproteobacteria bacterium]
MSRTILHIDMDAFFAAIEALDDSSLKGKPVIVGGLSRRGVVSTASYEARRFGIHSAMPVFKAREKCPHGIFLPVKMERYKEVSRKIMGLLKDFSPLVEQVSIDEAYLDITGTENLFGCPEDIARRIKERVGKETGLTCSIGIAPNKFMAKVASDMNKPDGLKIISDSEVDQFLSILPVGKIPGVGKRTLEELRRHSVKTVGDLKRFSKEQLLEDFGKFGLRLYNIAKGRDNESVTPDREIKSISSEETLQKDTGDLSKLKDLVKEHAEKVAWRLRNEELKGKTITIKIKFSDFSAFTKSQTIAEATDSSKILRDSAMKLFLDSPIKRKVRLIGVAVSNLDVGKKQFQMSLFEDPGKTDKNRKVEEAMDEIRGKFGGKVIERGKE